MRRFFVTEVKMSSKDVLINCDFIHYIKLRKSVLMLNFVFNKKNIITPFKNAWKSSNGAGCLEEQKKIKQLIHKSCC